VYVDYISMSRVVLLQRNFSVTLLYTFVCSMHATCSAHLSHVYHTGEAMDFPSFSPNFIVSDGRVVTRKLLRG
jgi:hypothetical protein